MLLQQCSINKMLKKRGIIGRKKSSKGSNSLVYQNIQVGIRAIESSSNRSNLRPRYRKIAGCSERKELVLRKILIAALLHKDQYVINSKQIFAMMSNSPATAANIRHNSRLMVFPNENSQITPKPWHQYFVKNHQVYSYKSERRKIWKSSNSTLQQRFFVVNLKNTSAKSRE